MKILTAAGAIHIERDREPPSFVCCTLEGMPADRIYLVPVVRAGGRVFEARNRLELARRIGVIAGIQEPDGQA
jgi:hypothetical protein